VRDDGDRRAGADPVLARGAAAAPATSAVADSAAAFGDPAGRLSMSSLEIGPAGRLSVLGLIVSALSSLLVSICGGRFIGALFVSARVWVSGRCSIVRTDLLALPC
jgi:hypothetical protein